MKENDLYTFTLCREDWETVMGALRALSLQRIHEAHEVGPESTYGAVLFDEAGVMQAIASDIDFILPE
jgi:hypothetical protein